MGLMSYARALVLLSIPAFAPTELIPQIDGSGSEAGRIRRCSRGKQHTPSPSQIRRSNRRKAARKAEARRQA